MSKRIPLFYIVTALFWFSIYSYVPILSTYAIELGASATLVGLIGGSYGFTQMILRIPLGIVSDMLKKRRVFIMLGLMLGVVSGLGVFLFPDKYALLIFRGISGFSAAAWVIFTVLFTSYFKPNETPKAIGYLMSFNNLGTLCAQLCGGLIAGALGNRYSFILGAAAGAIGLILSFWIIDDRDVKKEPLKISELIKVGNDKLLMLVSILAIFSQFIIFATALGFTPVLAERLGATQFQLGLLSMCSSLPTLLLAPLSGTLFLKKLGAKRTICIGFVIAAVACVATPFAGSLPILFAAQLAGACGCAMVFPLLTGLSIINFDERRRASAMGFYQAIYGVGMFFGPVCLGFIGDLFNLTVAFLIISLMGFAGAAITYINMPKLSGTGDSAH